MERKRDRTARPAMVHPHQILRKSICSTVRKTRRDDRALLLVVSLLVVILNGRALLEHELRSRRDGDESEAALLLNRAGGIERFVKDALIIHSRVLALREWRELLDQVRRGVHLDAANTRGDRLESNLRRWVTSLKASLKKRLGE